MCSHWEAVKSFEEYHGPASVSQRIIRELSLGLVLQALHPATQTPGSRGQFKACLRNTERTYVKTKGGKTETSLRGRDLPGKFSTSWTPFAEPQGSRSQDCGGSRLSLPRRHFLVCTEPSPAVSSQNASNRRAALGDVHKDIHAIHEFYPHDLSPLKGLMGVRFINIVPYVCVWGGKYSYRNSYLHTPYSPASDTVLSNALL